MGFGVAASTSNWNADMETLGILVALINFVMYYISKKDYKRSVLLVVLCCIYGDISGLGFGVLGF